VTVFAAGRSNWTGREQRLRGREIARSLMFDGVRFVWVRTFPYRGNSWRRVVNMISYAVVVCVVQTRHPAPDVVVGSTVHPLAALAGWVIAKLRGARFIYEVRDLWPQTLIDLGALAEDSPGARGLAALERFLVRRAETVITVLPGMSAYLADRGLPTHHVRYLPNGALLTSSSPSDGSNTGDPRSDLPLLTELRQRRGGEIVFAYLGSHGRVNRLDVVLRAIQQAAQQTGRPLRLVLVGDGPEKPALRELAADLAIRGVTFADPIPKNLVPEFLRTVDVGVVHATRNPVYRFGTSFNKVFDYMAAETPIAFGCSTAFDPVAAAGAGISVAPDEPEALAGAFVRFAMMDRSELRRMGVAGRRFLEREHDMVKIGDAFASLVGCHDPAAP
jgi:glycosyltransferase involved in cell wall biosynthesis